MKTIYIVKLCNLSGEIGFGQQIYASNISTTSLELRYIE